MGSPLAHPGKALHHSLLPTEESTKCHAFPEPFPRAPSPISRVFLSLLKSQLHLCLIFFLLSISSSCSLYQDCVLVSANSSNLHLSHLFQPHLPHLSSRGFPDFPLRWAFLLSSLGFPFSLHPYNTVLTSRNLYYIHLIHKRLSVLGDNTFNYRILTVMISVIIW